MPRTLSGAAVAAMMAANTEEAFLLLLTLTHEPTSETYRCVLNTEDVVSNGNTFTATYFKITLPEVSDRAPQGCQITVDNVDRMLVGLLRQITEPLKVTVQLVLASSPNTVELEITDLVLREVSWDSSQIQGTLVAEDPLNQVFPGHMYDPRSWQGVF